MNVLTSAQIAAHDIAPGIRDVARAQQAPRRLDIADLAELRAKVVRPAEQPAAPQPAARPPAGQEAAQAERKPVRPGTFLDIRV